YAFPNLRSIRITDHRKFCSSDCPHYDGKRVDMAEDRIIKLKTCAVSWFTQLKEMLPKSTRNNLQVYYLRKADEMPLIGKTQNKLESNPVVKDSNELADPAKQSFTSIVSKPRRNNHIERLYVKEDSKSNNKHHDESHLNAQSKVPAFK